VTTTWWRRATAAWWVAAAFTAAGLVSWLLLTPEQVVRLISEEGPVEGLSAATYALGALAVWHLRVGGDDWRSTLAQSAVKAGFCMRELDWHKAFTGTSVLRLSWYGGPASLQAKLAAAAVVLAFAAALGWLVARHARAWLAALRRRDAAAVSLLVFVLTLVVAKTLDRSAGILADDFGVTVEMRWRLLIGALEEWMELGLTMLLLLGLAQRRADAR
jgi:hypothetical protein